MLSRLFNRVHNHERFFRFRRTAFAVMALTYVPFGYGLYAGAGAAVEVVKTLPAVTTETVVFQQSVKNIPPAAAHQGVAAALLIAASYMIGSPATAYYLASRRFGPKDRPKSWINTII